MSKIKCYVHIILLLFGLSTFVFSQSVPQLQINWSQLGYNNGELAPGLTTKDFNGNLYVLTTIRNGTSVTLNGTTVSGGNLGVGAIIKYDTNQNPVWIKEIPFAVLVRDNIAPHKFLFHNGALYLFVAYKQNNISMDGINFPPYQSNIGTGDLALIKIDVSTQNTEWIRFMARPECFSTIPPDNFEIYFDKNDKIHALGTFSNKLIFDEVNDTIGDLNNTTGVNAFHAIYDTTGTLLSAKDLGIYNGNPNYYAHEYFSIDNQNNIYRYINDTKTFIKYDEQGNILFSKQFTSNGVLRITGMKVDPWHNVVLSGYFSSSTMSFDGILSSKTGGTTDAVIIKFNGSNGNVEWLKNLQDPDCDRFDFINMDEIGNIYVLNNQYGWCISPGNSLLAKYSSDGVLLYKNVLDGTNLPNGSQITMTRGSNISLPPNGGNIIVSGYANYGQNNQKGFMMEYGICNTPTPIVNLDYSDICEGGFATLSVDSLSGYKYLWSNGDTTATIQINEAGRYSVVAIEDEECYSESEDFYINVHPLPDTSVTVNNNILTATDTTQNLSYQWIDCQNGNAPISGAVNSTFEPTENGEYAVILTNSNGCLDTSACHIISTLDVKNNPLLDRQITLYPNPTSDNIVIQTDLETKNIVVLDLQGKKLIESTSKQIDLSKLSSGIYLIKVELPNNESWTSKVIKE